MTQKWELESRDKNLYPIPTQGLPTPWNALQTVG